jgi:hypothetical protein
MIKILIVLALALVGCQKAPSDRYETVNQARWKTVTIEMHWGAKEDITSVCQSLGASDSPSNIYNGCARSKPDDVNICEIYATQPNKFDDTADLAVLGHEVWHCLGAKHK